MNRISLATVFALVSSFSFAYAMEEQKPTSQMLNSKEQIAATPINPRIRRECPDIHQVRLSKRRQVIMERTLALNKKIKKKETKKQTCFHGLFFTHSMQCWQLSFSL